LPIVYFMELNRERMLMPIALKLCLAGNGISFMLSGTIFILFGFLFLAKFSS